MPIVGGLDIHRKQLRSTIWTPRPGRWSAASRPGRPRAPAAWLGRTDGRDDVASRWKDVRAGVRSEELARQASRRVAEPADTTFARRRKRHAKTDKTDSRHLRSCWPRQAAGVLDSAVAHPGVPGTAGDLSRPADRAHRLGAAHPHLFFRQGAAALDDGTLRTDRNLEALHAAAAVRLSPAGQLQVATGLDMLARLEARLDVLRHRLLAAPGACPAPGCSQSGCTGSARSPRWR